MKEIRNGLFIGSQEDLNNLDDDHDFSLCLAAKTFHQITLGYKGNINKDHPNYLIFEEPEFNRISLNLIDAPDVKYIPEVIINACLRFINKEIEKGNKVLVCCNQGRSRSASVGLMYMLINDKHIFKDCSSIQDVFDVYKAIYEQYEPNKGMLDYTVNFCNKLTESERIKRSMQTK